jgi:hypothetical protein
MTISERTLSLTAEPAVSRQRARFPASDSSRPFIEDARRQAAAKPHHGGGHAVVLEGEGIEDYPDDPRGHSCLMLGTAGGRSVHIV